MSVLPSGAFSSKSVKNLRAFGVSWTAAFVGTKAFRFLFGFAGEDFVVGGGEEEFFGSKGEDCCTGIVCETKLARDTWFGGIVLALGRVRPPLLSLQGILLGVVRIEAEEELVAKSLMCFLFKLVPPYSALNLFPFRRDAVTSSLCAFRVASRARVAMVTQAERTKVKTTTNVFEVRSENTS